MIQFNKSFFADAPALAGKSVIEMCKLANLNPASYYRALKGARVRLSALLSIANACNVAPQAFFFDDAQPLMPTSQIYSLNRCDEGYAFAFSPSTTIPSTGIKWAKAFRAEDGYQYGRISRMLNPEASSMYLEDVCYACNANSISPSAFFRKETNEKEASKALLLDRLDLLMRDVATLKSQLAAYG